MVCFSGSKNGIAAPTNLTSSLKTVNFTLKKPEKMKGFSREFLGFNVGMTVSKKSPGNYFSEEVRWMVDQLPVGALRFPGGTYSNFFNWDCMCLDVDAIYASGHENMIENVSFQKQINKGSLIKADFDSYIKLSLDKKLNRFIVLNVYTRDVEDNIKTIKMIKSKYPITFFWEMGNEVSYYAYRHKLKAEGGWDDKIYISKVQTISEYIKAQYPEDKIGLVISELLNETRLQDIGNAKIMSFEREISQWDDSVALSRFYDAVIIHPYINYRTEKEWMNIIDDTTNLYEMKTRWIFSTAQVLPRIYSNKIKERFPKKEIWITESGLLGTNDDGFPDHSSTTIRSLFNVAYFLSWLKENSAVKVYLFHHMSHGKKADGTAAFFNDFSFNPNTISYAFIKEALNKADAFGFIDTSGGPTYYGAARYRDTVVQGLSALYITAPEHDKILLVNTSSAPIHIENLPFNNSQIIYWGGNNKKELKPGEIKSFQELNTVHLTNNKWEMPPYSIALLLEKVN